MNLLHTVQKNNCIVADMPLHSLLYLYMVSYCYTYEEAIYSELSVLELYERFSKNNYTDDEIADAIDYLVDKGLIIKTRQTIQIGYISETRKHLYTGAVESFTEEYDSLMEYADLFVEALRSNAKSAAASKVKKDLQELFDTTLNRWKIFHFLELYRLTLTVYFQDFQGDFNKTEFGMMKSFIAKYDPITCIKIIVHYVVNNEKYGKSFPTLKNLLYHKDTIKASIKGLNGVQKQVSRTTRIKDKF